MYILNSQRVQLPVYSELAWLPASQVTRVWNRNQARRFKINLNIFCDCFIMHFLNALRSTFPPKKHSMKPLGTREEKDGTVRKGGGTVRKAVEP